MDSGDRLCNIMNVFNTNELNILKMVNMVNFMFCAFYHDKKKKKETNQEDSHMNRRCTSTIREGFLLPILGRKVHMTNLAY